jgi:hypothetical protein
MTSPVTILICIGFGLVGLRFLFPRSGRLAADPRAYRWATGAALLFAAVRPLVACLIRGTSFDFTDSSAYVLYLFVPPVALLAFGGWELNRHRSRRDSLD